MYDVAIIGGGPAGYNGAIRASELGLKVALIEKAELGGTCLNRGCIPTKSLLKSAELIEEAKSSGLFGVAVENISFSLDKIYERKDMVIDKLRKGVAMLMKKYGVTVIEGEASFRDANTLSVKSAEGEQTLTASNFIIATGSTPSELNIPGAKSAINSEDVLKAPINVKDIVIIGGGVIGVEYACFFSGIGVQVTVVEAEQRILPVLDKDISVHLALQLKKRGVKLITGALVREIADSGKKVIVEKDGATISIETEATIISIGRTANIKNLKLDKAGVNYDRRIITDCNGRTNVANIFAVGDAASPIQLAHYAEASALNTAEIIAGNKPTINLSVVPSCIYTVTEIASVGILDAENTFSGKALMGANGKANIEDKTSGFVKTVFDKESGRLIGAVIMCSRATDMIAELALALSAGLTAIDIAKTIHPHPTLSEAVRVSAEEALRTAAKQ
jgi:dihydrolipoamide dehydrogenase